MAQSWALAAPLGVALERVGGAQDGGFVEHPADQLEADRQAIRSRARRVDEPARHADRRQSREVGAHREDVGEIHLQRVVGLLAEPERRNRAGRHRDDVDRSKARS